MVTKELISFIQEQKNKGLNDNTIKGMLLNSGWAIEDINQAFPLPAEALAKEGQNTTPPPQETVTASIQNTEMTPMSPRARLLIIFLTLAVVVVFALGIAYFGKKYIQSQKNQASSGGRNSSPFGDVLNSTFSHST